MRHKKNRKISFLELVLGYLRRIEAAVDQLTLKEQKNTIKLTSMFELSSIELISMYPYPNAKELELIVRDRITKQIAKYMFDEGLITITQWSDALYGGQAYHGSIEVVIGDK